MKYELFLVSDVVSDPFTDLFSNQGILHHPASSIYGRVWAVELWV